jgi:DNA invertase Pin-like site-specific DNA recombinase
LLATRAASFFVGNDFNVLHDAYVRCERNEKNDHHLSYARVSTTGQDLTSQRTQLKAAGCDKIFEEKQSGAGLKNRKQLSKALAALEEGDVLIVTALDRLARSNRDLWNTLHTISERKAGFRSLKEPMIDSPHGKLVTAILGAIGEFERSLIITRTTEGRHDALARGVRFGRKPKLNQHQRTEIRKLHDDGQTERQIAKTFAVNQSTIHRLLAETRQEHRSQPRLPRGGSHRAVSRHQ